MGEFKKVYLGTDNMTRYQLKQMSSKSSVKRIILLFSPLKQVSAESLVREPFVRGIDVGKDDGTMRAVVLL